LAGVAIQKIVARMQHMRRDSATAGKRVSDFEKTVMVFRFNRVFDLRELEREIEIAATTRREPTAVAVRERPLCTPANVRETQPDRPARAIAAGLDGAQAKRATDLIPHLGRWSTGD